METEKRISLKKLLIGIGAVIILCGASFCAGRFVRFRGASATGEQLIEGIILSRDTANSIADRLGIAGFAGDSATELGLAITRGIEELQRTNEVQRLCLNNIIGEVERTQQNIEIIQSNLTAMSDATEYGFRLAEEQASAYERIIRELQPLNVHSSENE